jgi:hypothetical protein
MEEAFSKVEELAGEVKEYFNTRLDSVKLDAAEKTSKVTADLIAGVMAAVIFLLFFLFINFTLAYALAEWIGKTWAGFLIVSGFYLLAGIFIWVVRQKLIGLPLMNRMIGILFKPREEDEED